jgi:hypothetical protein
VRATGDGRSLMNVVTRMSPKTNTRSKKISNRVVRCVSAVATGRDRRIRPIRSSSPVARW